MFSRRNLGAVVMAGMLVAAVYALPLVMAYARHGIVMHVSVVGDAFYGAGVVNVARGGALSNPYLLEDQDAPRARPDLTERVMGVTTRWCGASPRTTLVVSRVSLPVAIFLLILLLALDLGLDFPRALVAAGLAPLLPSSSIFSPAIMMTGGGGFLRYFRYVSPASHVMLFLLFLLGLHAGWKRATTLNSWRPMLIRAAMAGIALGLLARTPMYYWTLAFAGVILLAAISRGPARRFTLLVLLAGLVVAGSSIAHSFHVLQDPRVQDSLDRELEFSGHGLQRSDVTRFLFCWPPIMALWQLRRRIPGVAAFLLPFLIPGAFFFLQNVVTGREVQAYHWTNLLIPLWTICIGLLAREMFPRWTCSLPTAAMLFLAVAGVGAVVQILAMSGWEADLARDPALFALDWRMPRTLRWIEQHTPVNSVVLANEGAETSLTLYTGRKIFWTEYAGVYAVPESEYILRTHYLDAAPSFRRPPPYRVDYYLGENDVCRQLSQDAIVFRDAGEQTCLWSFAKR